MMSRPLVFALALASTALAPSLPAQEPAAPQPGQPGYDPAQAQAAAEAPKRRWAIPRFKAPNIRMPKLRPIKPPKIELPKFKPIEMPKLRMPRFRLPGRREAAPVDPNALPPSAPQAQPQVGPTAQAPAAERVGRAHYVVTRDRTKFYTLGPNQPMGPDAYLTVGTTVVLLKTWRGWCDVRLQDGRVGTVASNTLRAAAANEVPRVVPARPPVDVTPRDFEGVDTSDPPEEQPLPTSEVERMLDAEADPAPEDFVPPELPEGIPAEWVLGDSSLVPSFTEATQPVVPGDEVPVAEEELEPTGEGDDGAAAEDDPEADPESEDGEDGGE